MSSDDIRGKVIQAPKASHDADPVAAKPSNAIVADPPPSADELQARAAILKRQTDLDRKARSKGEDIFGAAFWDYIDRANEILAAAPDEANRRNIERQTPLFWCVSAEMTEALIKAGADVDAREAIGETPLMNAVANGRLEVARVLIAHHADISLRDNLGHRAILYVNMLASVPKATRCEMCKLLVGAGANINEDGGNLLISAARANDLDDVKFLMGLGAVNKAPGAVHTAYQEAVLSDAKDTEEFLKDK